MNPLMIKPLTLIASLCITTAMGAIGGWTANGWRKDAEIADLKQSRAEDSARLSQAALDDIARASKHIADQASGAQVDLSSLNTQLAAIRKEFKNAKPLPVDCRPDTPRVRKLTDTINAVEKTIAGQRVSSTVQSERTP